MSIFKATVLGAGVMGSQIAALLVNAGLKVELLDIVIDESDKNKLSKAAFERITHPKKGMLYEPTFASNLTYSNFTDAFEKQSDSDIFIEAVAERIDIKHDLWSKVSKIAKKDAILATNTSGIPIEKIAEVLDDEMRERFIGMHFFNPPRFMKLVELIPNTKTSKETINRLSEFSVNRLGKGVVPANDVPGFIANRIGTYSSNDIMLRAEKSGFSIAEVDALTGEYIGRPKLGTFKLGDMVGLDIAYNVIKGMLLDPSEQSYFKVPETLEKMVQAKLLGNKTKQGFYKKEGRNRYVINPETLEYLPLEKVSLPFQEKLGRSLKENLQTIFHSQDKEAIFLWETLRNVFYYSAVNVPKAAHDYKNIDRAIVWGYNWKLGPFQLWDLMGFEQVKNRMKEELGSLPEWIENRSESFYQKGDSISHVAAIENKIEQEIWKKEDTTLSVINGNQLLLKMQTPANSITPGFSQDLYDAVDFLEKENYSSMVLYSNGANFCVGANLFGMKQAIEANQVNELIAPGVDILHNAIKRLRYATKPIVTAAQGRALGGGAELLLASPFVVAAAETYIGLVEVGVGLIPSGGGVAELTERILKVNETPANRFARLAKLVENISSAFVSMNAYQAKAEGFLRDTDVIIQNEELRVYAALELAKFYSEYGYQAAKKYTYIAPGRDFKAIVESNLDAMRLGHFISDYDMEVGLSVADIVAGGDLPRNTYINHDYLLDLEKKNFLKLSGNQKTYERIAHMLATKRPLRN
ncbi:3-hydroxyacyl-CoA dehydrogenase/enoyl-CoA hydratase family protein [Streptococcus uberis]|uniref:3-hydroxyacyl-CoA dehydrogenase/crotonase FadB n=1 Tax=Streptococcus uberis TaxID=1349 RepID=UPI0027DBFCF2|nr:3-hydroxyacyl-CoA dehydrogenase/enoyl-CoA hydratase family protein [Streptococcus uberis]MCK1158454.1 3-hydroxyacyl-CoA dehydrogenase/enoyl-CoA hydratase family protein [Streptococcus uberis]